MNQIRKQNIRITENLAKELAEAKHVHERNETRYQKHLLELESIKSERSVSQRLVTLLEQQCASLQEENGRLDGLLHPIRRIPEDVLRSIFEWIVLSNPDTQLKMATRISQVCQQWRYLALHTGSLWTQIAIKMGDSLMDIGAFMQRTLERLRSASPMITLSGISVNQLRSFMGICNIGRFQSIEELTLCLTSSEDASLIDSTEIFKYSGRLETLNIFPNVTSNLIVDLKLSSIFKAFPTAKHLVISHFPAIISGAPSLSSNLRSLSLLHASFSANTSLFSSLPSLEELSFYNVCWLSPVVPAEMKTLNNLRHLVIWESPGIPWSHFITPKLQDLTLCKPDNEAIEFSCRNPTISKLRLNHVTEEACLRLSEALPSVNYLDISVLLKALYDWTSFGSDHPPFPKLEAMTLVNMGERDMISGEALERLVRMRCLCPLQCNQDLALQLIKEVRITTLNFNWMNPPWLKNSWIEHSETGVRGKCYELVLTWPSKGHPAS